MLSLVWVLSSSLWQVDSALSNIDCVGTQEEDYFMKHIFWESVSYLESVWISLVFLKNENQNPLRSGSILALHNVVWHWQLLLGWTYCRDGICWAWCEFSYLLCGKLILLLFLVYDPHISIAFYNLFGKCKYLYYGTEGSTRLTDALKITAGHKFDLWILLLVSIEAVTFMRDHASDL